MNTLKYSKRLKRLNKSRSKTIPFIYESKKRRERNDLRKEWILYIVHFYGYFIRQNMSVHQYKKFTMHDIQTLAKVHTHAMRSEMEIKAKTRKEEEEKRAKDTLERLKTQLQI